MKTMENAATGSSLRHAIIEYAARRYGSRPEYLWSNAPNYVVLRHHDSLKWYGLIMDIPRERLSLPGDGRTDILEIKCDPTQKYGLLRGGIILPAYHMRKGDWVAVLLDGSVDLDDIYPLLDTSVRMTAPEETAASTGAQAPGWEETLGDISLSEEPFHASLRETCYRDEPIRFSPERVKHDLPKEYRGMRELAPSSPFSHHNDAKIFYLQARYMEHFEDDCPFDREFICYYPTYQSMSTAELRGYFTWRTRLRHGELDKTSLSYAYLYIYELLHQIGSATKEEGLAKLLWFYTQYGAIDPKIQRYAKQWIVEYAVYYDLPTASIQSFIHSDFDEALDALVHCDTVSEETLFSGILRLSSYRLDKSKAYKQHPAELLQVISQAYRMLNARYANRYRRPYTQKLYGGPVQVPYVPFRSAVFYDHLRRDHYEYRLTPLQVYRCQGRRWTVELGYLSPQRSQDLGLLVRTADRMVREAYGIKPGLKAGAESKTMVQFIGQAIEEQKRAVRPKVEFDLSLLGGIRKSADAIGQKLMTQEEREPEEELPVAPAAEGKPDACILSGNALRFLQLLLYGGDLPRFLSEQHLMASVVAETINQALYEEFADTVIEFDGNTPVIVEDYLEDLKGMIPS